MSRRAAAVQRLPGAPTDYQCTRVDDVWHATQEQALPPHIHSGGAWTICCVWATFTRGFERRRPTCPECLLACVRDEGIAAAPGQPGVVLDASAVVPIKQPKTAEPLQAQASAREVAAIQTPAAPAKAPSSKREAILAEEASFEQRLREVVDATRKRGAR